MTVECDYCGETFGNAGALASHKPACPDRPTNNRGGSQTAQTPATQAQTPQGGQQNEIQTPEQAEAGGQLGQMVGEMVDSFDADDPKTRATAKAMGAEALAAGIKHLGQKAAQEEIDRAQRAQQNAGRDAKVADESITCPECGKGIPPADTATSGVFYCIHCGAPLELE